MQKDNTPTTIYYFATDAVFAEDSSHMNASTTSCCYDTRCYFNVQSKADMNQFNLPHGTNNQKVEKQKN